MFVETPTALWLFPAGVLALLLLQLWQARRRELLVGSLFIWRRVAEKERARPRRRLVLDRSFWLQVAALLALALAWANPVWQGLSAPGRRFVILVDNGPSARLRQASGAPLWDRVRSMASGFLEGLSAGDRVILCTAVPFSRHRPSNDGLSPQRAREDLGTISPGLTPIETTELWRYALEEARRWASDGHPVRTLVFSIRPAASGAADHPSAAWVAVPSGGVLGNVALTAFGASPPFEPGPNELLVQVRNFGAESVSGRVTCEADGGPAVPPREVTLAPGDVAGVVFAPGPFAHPLRLAWVSDAGPDALPEDDRIAVVPKPTGPPRIRWHGSAPHLQDLYRLALGAQELSLEARETADLDVFVECLPAAPVADSNAVLLLAPPAEYFPFEVLPGVLERPVARLGENDPLTRGLSESAAGLDWPIAKARTIRQVGDLRVLAQDRQGNVLAARFLLKDDPANRLRKPSGERVERVGHVWAFVPGEGLGWAAERKFDSPGLATVLLRLVREACGADRPFRLRSAEELEGQLGRPLPLAWVPGFDEREDAGQGVLDARASQLPAAAADTVPASLATLAPAAVPERHPLGRLFVLLAIALLLFEVRAGKGPDPTV